MFGLNPIVLYAALGLLVASNIATGVATHHFTSLSWEASIARQEAKAAGMLADRIASNAVAEIDSANSARTLDMERTAYADQLQATHDDFTKQLADRVRIATGRKNCPGSLPSPSASPSVPEANPEGSPDRLSESIAGRLSTLGDNANTLKDDFLKCRTWALDHGR